MALSSGNKVTWADIQAIYSKLNTCQTKFNITKTTAPSNPGKCSPTVISNLKTFIFALSTSSWVSTSFVSPVFNLTTPVPGDLLKATPFNTMTTSLNNVSNICINFSDDSDDGAVGFSNSNFTADFSDFSNQGSVETGADGYY